MQLTTIGNDYLELNDDNWETIEVPRNKVHIIKLQFINPIKDQLNKILVKFYKTNRFVIDNHIYFYNYYFKDTHKKYYVENTYNSNLISFFRKNNKILFNFKEAPEIINDVFLYDYIFKDILYNVEVIKVSKEQFDLIKNYIQKWNGNVIIE